MPLRKDIISGGQVIANCSFKKKLCRLWTMHTTSQILQVVIFPSMDMVSFFFSFFYFHKSRKKYLSLCFFLLICLLCFVLFFVCFLFLLFLLLFLFCFVCLFVCLFFVFVFFVLFDSFCFIFVEGYRGKSM